jgi:hypothetical protein
MAAPSSAERQPRLLPVNDGLTRQLGMAALGSCLVLAGGCTSAGSGDYRGGVVIDPAGVAVNVDQELVDGHDQRVAGLGKDGTLGAVDGRTVTIARRAEYCSHRPDVVLEVDGADLKAHLVMPPGGQPCPVCQGGVRHLRYRFF